MKHKTTDKDTIISCPCTKLIKSIPLSYIIDISIDIQKWIGHGYIINK